VARANLGWADWKEGEATSALENLHSAATLWPVHPHPIVWLLAWPRLAVDLTQGRVTEAIEQARMLVNPPTMRMPAAVEDSLRAAIETAESGRLDDAAAALTKSVALAEKTGWL